MKTIVKISAVLSMFLVSCTSMQQTAVNDDLYFSPSDKSSNDLYASDNGESKPGKSYVHNKELDQKISALLEDESLEEIDTTIYEDDETGNPYQDIVVDSYDEAYQKRLEAKQSGTYGITNNYFVLNSSDYWYASAYLNDPFYNVIIVGDQVWVEPRWLSTSFGFYPRPYYSYYGYYGYYDPYYYDPFYYSYYRPYYNNYYRPYYYGHPYYSINNYYYGDNNNWASSGNNSFRRRGTTTTNPDGINRSSRGTRSIPESYIGNDIRKTRTLKDGIDDQAARTTSVGRTDRVREKREGIQDPERTTRTSGAENTRTRQEITRKRTSTEGSATRTYTRPTRQSSSTYDASKRNTTTRYTRPERSTTGVSTNTRSNSGSSTYSPARTSTPTRSTSGGSKYTPARSSSGNSSGTVRSTPSKSSSGSSGNSGSSRSSGSSSGNSGNSGNSSGSSRGGRR
ncbi:MAG: hypothetical protein RBT49_09985 [Bacteroidales bacterium]|jgi:hypothetical protein|nr:hypothetical protein [Bacteroidales bacterium]